MDIQELLLVQAGSKGKKRRRGSTSSLPPLAKKSKVDPTEDNRPASAPPLTLGNATDPEIDLGDLYIEEDKEQMTSDGNDQLPHPDVDIFPDNVPWSYGMMLDMDFEQEDIQSISSDESAPEDETEDEDVSDFDPETYY